MKALLVVIAIGMVVTAVCGWYLLRDWAALNATWTQFERLAAGGADLRTLFVAESRQNIFRVNCFAEGVGVLLGLIIAAIGVHGLSARPGTSAGAPPGSP